MEESSEHPARMGGTAVGYVLSRGVLGAYFHLFPINILQRLYNFHASTGLIQVLAWDTRTDKVDEIYFCLPTSVRKSRKKKISSIGIVRVMSCPIPSSGKSDTESTMNLTFNFTVRSLEKYQVVQSSLELIISELRQYLATYPDSQIQQEQLEIRLPWLVPIVISCSAPQCHVAYISARSLLRVLEFTIRLSEACWDLGISRYQSPPILVEQWHTSCGSMLDLYLARDYPYCDFITIDTSREINRISIIKLEYEHTSTIRPSVSITTENENEVEINELTSITPSSNDIHPDTQENFQPYM